MTLNISVNHANGLGVLGEDITERLLPYCFFFFLGELVCNKCNLSVLGVSAKSSTVLLSDSLFLASTNHKQPLARRCYHQPAKEPGRLSKHSFCAASVGEFLPSVARDRTTSVLEDE